MRILRPWVADRAGRIVLPLVMALAVVLPGGLLLTELAWDLLVAGPPDDHASGAGLGVILLMGVAFLVAAALGLVGGALLAWRGGERTRMRALVLALAALALQVAILLWLLLSGP